MGLMDKATPSQKDFLALLWELVSEQLEESRRKGDH